MKAFGMLIGLIAAFFCIYVLWLAAHHLLYSRTVLEMPMQLAPGLSFAHSFTVGPAAKYWVGVEYQKIFRSTPTAPIPQDEFAANFEISSERNLVTRGGTDSFPDWQKRWVISRDYVIRLLAPFDANAGAHYDLSAHIVHVSTRLASAEAKLVVFVDPLFDEGYLFRTQFVIGFGFGLATSVAIYLFRRIAELRA
jgi:hypothetical protein